MMTTMKTKDKALSETSGEVSDNRMPRRDFFKITTGGIIFFFNPLTTFDLLSMPAVQARRLPEDYNAFLLIDSDGTVNCFTGKIEMGQGIITSLPQMMADELNVPLGKVKMVMGDTDLCPWDAGTWGSLTTRAFGPAMRAAAAEARAVLVGMASERMGIPVEDLDVRDGVIYNRKNREQSISYGDIARGQKIEKYLDLKPPVEGYLDFEIVGKPLLHSDSYEKVTGKAKYTGDLRLPGMLHARVFRPPSHAARLVKLNSSEAEKIGGIQVLRDGDLVAVVGEDRDSVDLAHARLEGEYEFNERDVNDRTIFDYINKGEFNSQVSFETGDIDSGRARCTRLFEKEYHDPYLAHAPIEPHTALAQFEDGKLTVWASTQTPFGLQDGLTRELNIPREMVRVITPFLGGGFGGKAAYRQGVEAALLARMTSRPVMVAWSREDEFFMDTFHPASVIRVRSGIDDKGNIMMWDYNIFLAGTRGSEVIYKVPDVRITNNREKRDVYPVHPFYTGSWRAPNNNTNTFARETQIDIMADAAGIDPLDFRLMNLDNEQMRACLMTVAERFGYKPGRQQSGRGVGMACGYDANTWVAEMAEVEVDGTTGDVKIVRVSAVQDMGLCVNPQGALIQMEGCITMALGYTLTEEVKFEGGNILDHNFDTYRIPRFSWLPEIDCHILDRREMPPQGGGEPAIIAVGAAVGNAIFNATGARLLRVPFTPERVLEAIKALKGR